MVESCLKPDWPAPAAVKAVISTRQCPAGQMGSSHPYEGQNLALHVGDESEQVTENRNVWLEQVGAPSRIQWLQQVHSTRVVEAGVEPAPEADGVLAREAGHGCVVMTADCLPILLCDQDATCVAAVHAGWRGLADGILAEAFKQMSLPPERLMAYLGPAIGPEYFEVGGDVLDAFEQAAGRLYPVSEAPSKAFNAKRDKVGKFTADLYRLARAQLQGLGVSQLYGGQLCTYADSTRFYSYRRDGVTGRMAALIWLDGNLL